MRRHKLFLILKNKKYKSLLNTSFKNMQLYFKMQYAQKWQLMSPVYVKLLEIHFLINYKMLSAKCFMKILK